MKLLLTSAGLTNQAIRDAFLALLPVPAAEAVLVFVPTAANREADASWLESDLDALRATGIGTVESLDIENRTAEELLPRLEAAHAVCFGGGNTYFLLNCLRESGLDELLPGLMQDKVYVGISAGSMVAGPSILITEEVYPEDEIVPVSTHAGLDLVPFAVAPHLFSEDFTTARPENVAAFAEGVNYPIYAIDDDCAVLVDGGHVEVVGGGRSEIYNDG